MERWMTYFQERFPFGTMVSLVLGLSISGIYLHSNVFMPLPFLISFIGIFLFLALLRLMDEVKDFDKDCIAHRERPLPRGLIKKEEAATMVDMVLLCMFAYSMLIWVFLQGVAALAYVGLIVYLQLMYKEFGIGKWLNNRPVFYAISHQLVIFPVAFFLVSVAHPSYIFAASTWSFGLMLLGAFFCYEICRKLDPHAHPVLATYIHFYGFRKTFELALLVLALSAMGALALGYGTLLIPFEAIVLVSLCLLFFQSMWYKFAEITASISLLMHVWAVAIYHLF